MDEQRAKVTLARAIRRETRPSDSRQSCAICDRYPSITEAHHIPSVVQIAEHCLKYNFWFAQLTTIRFAWLCPTHHAVWHAIADHGTARAVEVMHDLSEEEKNRFREFAQFAERARAELVQEILDKREVQS